MTRFIDIMKNLNYSIFYQMKGVFLLLSLSLFLLFGFTSTSKVFGAYFIPTGGSSVVDFGDVYYNLETKTFSRNNIIKNLDFRNTKDDSSSGINTTVNTIAVYNQFANSFPYNFKSYTTGSPFQVYSPDLGYSASKYLTINTSIPSGEIGTALFRFSANSSHVQHCIDAKEKTCDIGAVGDTRNGIIYYQPYYCLITAPTSCTVSDGLQVQPLVDIKFLLPNPKVSVSSLNFNDVEVGESKSMTFEISNNTSDFNFKFVFPNNQGDFSSPSAGQTVSINPNDSDTFTIKFSPSDEGSVSRTYYFVDQRTDIYKIIGLGDALVLSGNGIAQETTQEPVDGDTITDEESEDKDTVDDQDNPEIEESPTSNDETRELDDTGMVASKPKTTYQTDSGLKIEIESNDEESDKKIEFFNYNAQSKSFSLSGSGKPNTNYIVYVYSDPIIVSVRTDENGIWDVEVEEDIKAGNHEIFMAEADENGYLLEDPKLISKVEIIETGSPSDSVTEEASEDRVQDNRYIYYLVVAVIVVLVATFLVYKYLIKNKQEKEGSKEG